MDRPHNYRYKGTGTFVDNRRGYFWGDRFKSVIVDRGETIVNCLAYIDLNPLRAGIVKQSEEYRWSSIGYHLQTNNRDTFLSTNFGLQEFNVKSEKERVRRYRKYMYHAGSIDRPDKGKIKVIDPRVLHKEKRKGFKITQASRLRYRTRYFTDSGIIGSKEFVSALVNAIKNGVLEADIFYRKESRMDVNGDFYKVETNEPDWEKTVISIDDIRSWLGARGVKKGFFFPLKDDTPDFLDQNHRNYAPKLAAAINAWQAVNADPELIRGKTVKQALQKWLRKNADKFGLTKDDGTPNEQGIEDIAKISTHPD